MHVLRRNFDDAIERGPVARTNRHDRPRSLGVQVAGHAGEYSAVHDHGIAAGDLTQGANQVTVRSQAGFHTLNTTMARMKIHNTPSTEVART